MGRGRGSIVDLTMVSESLVRRVSGWDVCDEMESISDHQYIAFALEATRNRVPVNAREPRGWRTDDEISNQDLKSELLLAK